MLSAKREEDRENHLVSLLQETGGGRAGCDGNRKSGLKHVLLPETAIFGNGR